MTNGIFKFNLNRLLIIAGVIFLLEVPGCIVVLADDAGQISYFEHEGLIKLSQKTFAAPLIQITGPVDSFASLLLVYVGNVLLLALLVCLLINGIQQVRINIKQRKQEMTNNY